MNEPFSQMFKQLRKDADLTQEELADDSYISVSLISRIERGDKIKYSPMSFRYSTLVSLAKALKLTEGSSKWNQFFEAAAERSRQKQAEKSGIATLQEPVPGENSEGDIPLNSSLDLKKQLILTGMKEVADCVLSMLTKASKEKLDKVRAENIFVTTLGESSIFRHLKREDEWNQAIRSVMKERKWCVLALYRLGDQKRAIEVIQEIRNLSIYPSRFIPRSCRRVGEVWPAYNLLIIPRVGALWGLSTHNPAVIDAAFFYPDTKEFEQHIRLLTDHFNLMFTDTVQLARTYGRHSTEWDDTMTRICYLEADEFLANNSIDTSTMPAGLFNEYLEKSLKPERRELSIDYLRLNAQAHYRQRREAFERNVQSFTYRTMMPWSSFEDAVGLSENAGGQCRYLLPYASGSDQHIYVEKSLAIEHIEHIIDDLRRYENYEIALIEDPKSVEDLLYAPWLVKGEVAVLTAIFTKSDDGQHPIFASEFELTETSLVRVYRHRFLALWGKVADQDKARQKENVIGKLTQLLEKAGGKPSCRRLSSS